MQNAWLNLRIDSPQVRTTMSSLSSQVDAVDAGQLDSHDMTWYYMNRSAVNRALVKGTMAVVLGRINEFATIEDAICFLDQHSIYEGSGEFRQYEVQVDFSNGDRVQASFSAKQRVQEFLAFVSQQ